MYFISGIEIKRSTNRVVPPSTAKQKQMLKKFFDVSLHVNNIQNRFFKFSRSFVFSYFTVLSGFVSM